ncbi:MAG: alkylation response protein AidB-like acyl-CoA dehydrogenase [Paracrocinitomix sp.]|jgi:alkylation response protein AidB-like acyl-CoA dehydrogenase
MNEEALREEAAEWLATNWFGERSDAFIEKVIDAKLAAPSWPVEWFGRGVSPDAGQVVAQEFAKVGAPGAGQDITNLWANTVLAFGSNALRTEQIRDLMLGRTNMCLLYSEPGAGSDLAGIQTKAERDGDEWIINGQKVWTSGGRNADFAFLIARTDWDVPKHRGISFFFLPMKQPGVEVRALRQATGDSRFNEVFLTNARVSQANMLGDLGQGWSVLQTALAYERAVMGESTRRRKQTDPQKAIKDAVRSADDEASAPIPDLSLVDLAQETGRNTDLVMRQQLMALHSLVQVNKWNGQRAKAELEQGTSSSIVSLGKLAMSRILHTAGSLQAELLGAEAMIGAADSARSGDATYAMLNAFFTSIGGGTDQIQRNIIGERVLGLPREPEVGKGVAFREVRQASVVER